ncbi:MAG: CidA/LrgA family protein [Thalassotalea sp.]
MQNTLYSIGAILLSLALGHVCYYFVAVIPASLYGMLILTVGLSTRLVEAQKLTATIKWSIANMGICFVPAAVGIVEYIALIKSYGVSITIIVVLTTLLLIAIVGFAYQTFISNKAKG